MFKFRLEPALRYRASIVQKNQRELAVVNTKFQQEKDKLVDLKNKRKSISEKYSDELGNLTSEEMVFYDNYFSRASAEIDNQIQVIAEVQIKLDEKRHILNESIKQKKIIETVKNKAYENYLKIEKKKEEALLDEISSVEHL